MSRHTTYRGTGIDMDSLRRDNEKVPALGNMGVNAKGDKIVRGIVTKTADQLARENHRIPQAILRTGLKGPVPEGLEEIKDPVVVPAAKNPPKKTERELPNGDIVEGD